MSQELICRICEGNEVLEFIFTTDSPNVAEKLMMCANVQVDFEDALPKYICLKCRRSLDFVYLFRIQCEEMDRKFREILASNKNTLIFEDQSDKLGAICEGNDDSYSNLCEPEEEEEYLVEEYADIEELHEDDDENSIGEDNSNTKTVILYKDFRERRIEDNVSIHSENENIDLLENNASPNESHNANEDLTDGEKYSIQESVCITDEVEILDQSEKMFLKDNIEAYSEENTIANTDLTKSALLEKYFSCDTCGKKFSSFQDFNKHKKTHGDNRYQCQVCMKWFSKRYRLNNHMAVHDESKSFCCEICGNKYTNQGNLDRHIRHFHKKEKPYMCTECGMSFSRSNILKLHYTVHINERNYECEICNKRFKADYYLKLHKKSHLPLEERRKRSRKQNTIGNEFSCTYCGKKSTNRALHRSHVRIHTGEKPFQCKFCKRKFSYRQSLKSHELLHTGEKPYHCELCGMAFRQIGHLKGHMLVHSGIKKHMCQYCGKSFALKSNLVVHQRLHTGETPYKCDLCSKKFYDSNGLKRHKHSHLKNKEGRHEMQQIQNLASLEPYFKKEEYDEVIEIEPDGKIKLMDLPVCN